MLFSDAFNNKTVLVTGHTGFKGSWLSIWLKMLGANVVGYGLEPPTNPSNFSLCKLEGKMEHIIGDVRDLDNLKEIMDQHRPDVIFHLAAQPIVLTSYQEPSETFNINVMGTVNLLEAARTTGCTKVFIGITSDKVYEDKKWTWGYRENDELGGFEPYSTSKAMAELAIRSYRRSWSQQWMGENNEASSFSSHGMAIASARAGNVIGGGDFADYRLIPDFMRACMENKPMELRNPDSVRPWQHLLEPLSGYLCLAEKLLNEPEEFDEAWNYGPKEMTPITCSQVIEKIVSLWGSGECRYPEQAIAAHEMSVLRVNWEKAFQYLNWLPNYSWEDALGETVSWWQAYKTQLDSGDEIDLYDVVVNNINEYVNKAQKNNIHWANAG